MAIILALVAAVGSWRRRDDRKRISMFTISWRYLAATGAVLAIYVAAMQFGGIGFAVATTCFIPVMGITAGARSMRNVIFLVGGGFVLAWGCLFLFTKVLVIDLP